MERTKKAVLLRILVVVAIFAAGAMCRGIPYCYGVIVNWMETQRKKPAKKRLDDWVAQCAKVCVGMTTNELAEVMGRAGESLADKKNKDKITLFFNAPEYRYHERELIPVSLMVDSANGVVSRHSIVYR